VGTPLDLVEAVEQGIDMFDCIIPTKMAQQGYAYTFQGLLRITRMAHRLEEFRSIRPATALPASGTAARTSTT
jgi:tRNA-guanine family transglycosylase